MPLIVIIVLLTLLRFFDISVFANLSWWWIAGLFAIAFVWFEFIEKIFGLDKKKAHNDAEKIRKERIRKTFGSAGRPE